MKTKEFKKVARLLTEAYKKLEEEALERGIDPLSDEYDQLQSLARQQILEGLGFSVEEYRKIKEQIAATSKVGMYEFVERARSQMEKIEKRIDDIYVPSETEISALAREIAKEVAREVIQEEAKPPQIINQIVKETVVEKPQVTKTYVTERVEYDDTPLREEVNLVKRDIESKSVELERFKQEIREDVDEKFKVTLREAINIMGMPDFRKLAMGLRADIDALRSQPSSGVSLSWVNVNGTIDGVNTAFTLASTPTTGVLLVLLGRQPQVDGVDITISGTNITYGTAPAEDLTGEPHIALVY